LPLPIAVALTKPAETIDDVLEERSIATKSLGLHAGELARFVP
jgi:hypothetical protein